MFLNILIYILNHTLDNMKYLSFRQVWTRKQMHSLNIEQFGELKKKILRELSGWSTWATINLLEKIWPWLRLFCFQKSRFESCQSHLDYKRKSASVKEQLKYVLGKTSSLHKSRQTSRRDPDSSLLKIWPNVFIYPYFSSAKVLSANRRHHIILPLQTTQSHIFSNNQSAFMLPKINSGDTFWLPDIHVMVKVPYYGARF